MPVSHDARVSRVVVRGLGVDVGIEVTGFKLARAVRLAWRDAISSSGPPTALNLRAAVGASDEADVAGETIDEVLHQLSPAVTTRMIERRAGELVMLHAAALADPSSGATVALVAPSGTGKTTAAATLGRSFAYLTDETTAITTDGLVLPYRKPLSVIESGHFKAQRPASGLGMMLTERPCRLAAILILDRQVSHSGEPRLASIEVVDALAALTPETSYLARLDRPLHRLTDLIDRSGGAHRVRYREAATLGPLVTRLLGGTS